MGKQAHQYFFENAFMARPRQVDLEWVCQAQVIAKEAFKATVRAVCGTWTRRSRHLPRVSCDCD